MCISAIIAGATIAGTAGSMAMGAKAASDSAAAARKQARAQANMYQYEARMEDINAGLARKQAQDTLETGRRKERDIVYKAGTVANSQDAAIASSGFVVGEGTAKDLKTDTYIKAMIDTNLMRENTNKEAWGFEMAAEDYTRKARYKRYAAENTLEAGAINADAAWTNFGSTLLTQGTNLVSNFANPKWW